MIIWSYRHPTTNAFLTVGFKLGDVLTYIKHSTRLRKLAPPHKTKSFGKTTHNWFVILKFANIVRDDVHSCRQADIHSPAEHESALRLYKGDRYRVTWAISFCVTWFNTFPHKLLEKNITFSQTYQQGQQGLSRCLCLKLHQVASTITPAWKVAPHLKYKDKKKMLFHIS